MFNHKHLKNYGMILAAVLGVSNVGASNPNLDRQITTYTNSRFPNYLTGLKSYSTRDGSQRGKLRLLSLIANAPRPQLTEVMKTFNTKRIGGFTRAFQDSVNTYFNLIQQNLLPNLPQDQNMTAESAGNKQNEYSKAFLVRRMLLPELDLDAIITGTRIQEVNKNNAYAVDGSGNGAALTMTNDGIALAVEREIARPEADGKHVLIHCIDSSILAVVIELVKQAQPGGAYAGVYLTPLADALCDAELKETWLGNVNNVPGLSLIKQKMSIASSKLADMVNKSMKLNDLVAGFRAENPFDVFRNEIANLLQGTFLRKSQHFTLMCRLEDGQLIVGVLPLSSDQRRDDLIEQFDQRGMLTRDRSIQWTKDGPVGEANPGRDMRVSEQTPLF